MTPLTYFIYLPEVFGDDFPAEVSRVKLKNIMQTSDEGYIMCGSLQDWSGDELAGFILKTYQNGNIDWSKIIEAEGVDRLPLTKIIQNSYGEYIVCGTYMEDYENQYQPEREKFMLPS